MFELTRLSSYSHLLKVNGASILLDCGSDNLAVDEDYLNQLELLAPTLSLILLSCGSLEYCGLLPFIREKGGVCPIYATLATREMARFTLQEWFKRRTEEEGTTQLPITVFDRVTPIRFTQPIHLTGQSSSLSHHSQTI